MLYAVLMYPWRIFYLRGVTFPQSYWDWECRFFAALFTVYVDCAARAAHRTAGKETPLWADKLAGAGCGVSALRLPAGAAGDRQWPAWHLFAVW